MQLVSRFTGVQVRSTALTTAKRRQWMPPRQTFYSRSNTLVKIHMLGNRPSPCTDSTCNLHVSKSMLSTADVILILHVAPIPRQNISSHVFNTRLVYKVQVQFSQLLQPASLASIQIRMHVDVLQWFMIRVHCTLGTMQIGVPFHTGLENGHEFPIGYMVPRFSGC